MYVEIISNTSISGQPVLRGQRLEVGEGDGKTLLALNRARVITRPPPPPPSVKKATSKRK